MAQLLARIPWTVSPSEVEGSAAVAVAAASEAQHRVWRDPIEFEANQGLVLWGKERDTCRHQNQLDEARRLCGSDELPTSFCRNKDNPLALRDLLRKRDML